jgi:cob(I)alamin adenosyltransferase
MRIYTKTGDDGTTGLLYDTRVSKGDLTAEAYGTVDEAVADLGVVRAEVVDNVAFDATLLQIQRDLFVVGADLATNPAERAKLKPEISLVTASMVERLEALIDETVAEHPLPEEFVVPGTNRASAALDVARTTVRRAERRAVQLRESGAEVNPEAIRYMNRLSDLLFVFARWQAGQPEPPSRAR